MLNPPPASTRLRDLLGLSVPAAWLDFAAAFGAGALEAEWAGGAAGPLEGLPVRVTLDLDLLAAQNMELRLTWRDYGWPGPTDLVFGGTLDDTYLLFVDTGSPAPAVCMWERDDEPGEHRALLPLVQLWQALPAAAASVRQGPRPIPAGTWLASRTTTPWTSMLDPITLDAWRRYVASQGDLAVIDSREVIHPFTRAITRLQLPLPSGYAQVGAARVPLSCQYGRLAMSTGALDAVTVGQAVSRLQEVAAALQLHVFAPSS